VSDTDEEHPHLTLADTARRLGECIWVEERLFELLGAQVLSDLPAPTRVTLAECSRQAAWRAEQLRARLPEVPGFAAEDVVVDPAVDRLEGASLEVLVIRVLPWLEASYDRHLRRCSPISDASVARTLDVVLGDLRRDAALLRTML
jgi:hypothetical protein